MITESFNLAVNYGISEGYVIAIPLLLILVTGIWTIIHPNKKLPTILFLVVSSFWLAVSYFTEEMADYRLFGMTIFLLGVIGVYVSIVSEN